MSPCLLFCSKNCVAKEVQPLVLEQSPSNAYAVNLGYKLVILNIEFPPLRAHSFLFSSFPSKVVRGKEKNMSHHSGRDS